MNWIGHLEERRNLVIGGVLLVTLSALAVTSLRSPVAFDPFWHLQMGKDWIENGLSPWVDHYSFTFHGEAIANPPVVFQAVLHWLESTFGLQTGFALFRLGSFMLILGAAWLLLRQIGAKAVVYAVVLPAIVYLLQVRSYVRPELISHTFMILAMMLYFRAGNRISLRNVLPMVLLIWIWTNYHTSIVGYVIFFGFFLDCAIEQIKTKAPVPEWMAWLGWGVLIVAVGFLNAGLSHPLLEAVTFPSEWKLIINEYLPPASFSKYRTTAIYALVALALLIPFLAFRQRRAGFLVIWALMVFAAVTMQRFVTPSGIVIVLLAAHLMTVGDAALLKRSPGRGADTAVAIFTLAFIGVMLFSNVERGRYIMKENLNTITRYPNAMVNYMMGRGMAGPIFNDYAIGGYLIYRLAPEFKVYIDGRTQILYPVEHMHRYMAATVAPDELLDRIETHDIRQILWRFNEVGHDVVVDMGGFGLEFADAYYALYTPEPANFSLLGRLLSRPACWKPELLDDLNAERRRMVDILPVYSVLIPYANFVSGYANSENGLEFFDASIGEGEWTDEMRRFAGYRFLEAGRYNPARMLFGGIQLKKTQDYLASAMTTILAGDAEVSAQILNEMSGVNWPRVVADDLYVKFQLYNSLARLRPLTPGEENLRGGLQDQLAGSGISVDPVKPAPAMLCKLSTVAP